MSYSCDWVIYPLPSKTQIYVASVILNEYSQVIDLNDPKLKPEGWDALKRPVDQKNPAKFVIYESHVRDFSALDKSASRLVRFVVNSAICSCIARTDLWCR